MAKKKADAAVTTKTTKAATTAKKAAAPRKPRTKKSQPAPVVEAAAPEVAAAGEQPTLVPGHYYEIDTGAGKVYGEAVDQDGSVVLDVWINGVSKGEPWLGALDGHPFREIDRTLAFELSHPHITDNPEGL